MTPLAPPSSASAFRLDINLLRALAVVGVVLFHFRIGPFTGGFAGVDLFFVVSGYLMTKIIADGLDQGRFSLWRFYGARARRILPALGALCLVLLVVSQLVIDPLTRREIASGIASSILFVSNFSFWRGAGYFDVASKENWLLHTWSLSVEWQFYLILPLTMMALNRLLPGRRWRIAAFWTGMILSFALAAWLATSKPVFTFYLLPTRAWEMLAGGLVYLHQGARRPGPRLSAALALAGLALIAIAFIGLDDLVPWPSFATLLPVGGTVLLLAARQEQAPGLGNPVVLALGLWSYSIYIWHWPIVMALGYFEVSGALATLCGLMATFALAGLSYRYIESPFRRPPEARRPGRWRPRPAVLAGVVILAGTTTASLVAASGRGEPRDALAPRVAAAEAAIDDGAYPMECGGYTIRNTLRPCVIGETAANNVLFIGDSHAELFHTHWEAGRPDHSFTFLTYGGCPPLPGVNEIKPGSRCDEFFDAAWERAASGDYQKVLIAAYWPIYLKPYARGRDNSHVLCFQRDGRCRTETDATRHQQGLDAAFAELAARIRNLRERGIEVTVLQPIPFAAIDIPRQSVKRAFLGTEPDGLAPIELEATREAAAAARERLAKLAEDSGARLVDPLEGMCEAGHCQVSRDGVLPDYRDTNHLTARAIRDGRLDFIDAAVLQN
ncbi:hypothetical protein K32_40110 [Kaistia sp. 32K]|uniref:acyltransferase family protein n=1 Tax=Kaistia sp. 32K TaxID=2795690 RepID=UPI0019150866|nr:acyltransferase family protein [Kaistia sp. 32K]BCP55394.1 hypothetical protein K32_40110 [Kaistia sp. 32K]